MENETEYIQNKIIKNDNNAQEEIKITIKPSQPSIKHDDSDIYTEVKKGNY